MTGFFKFYRWGMNMKLHMAIYSIALLCIACVIKLLLGDTNIEILAVFEIIFVSFVVAVIESFCFPLDKDLTKHQLTRNTVIWAVCANILFIASAWVFNWFAGIPEFAVVVLLVLLEGGLFAMWVGMKLIQRVDTKSLNNDLHNFQNK